MTTIAEITVRTMLGQRRAALLTILPAVPVLVALLVRAVTGTGEDAAHAVMAGLGFAVVVPLLALLCATSAIGSEIEDRSIVHLLATPVPRGHIVLAKAMVAAAWATLTGALGVTGCGLLLDPVHAGTAIAFGIGSAVAATAYVAVFVALCALTSHAVVIGLVYALVWESALGNLAPGVRRLSIQQWALSVVEHVGGGSAARADVGVGFGVVMLVGTTAAALALASRWLQSVTLSSAD